MTKLHDRVSTAIAATPLAFVALAFYVFAESAEPREPVIDITASRFEYTPGEITVRKGVPVVLQFRTTDVTMGFNLPDFKIRADLIPGQTTRVRLVPDKTGTFIFVCDVFCGSGHEEMNGKLTVVD